MVRKRGWHFLMSDMSGGYGTEGSWSVGEARDVEGPLRMCEWGYHASERPIDALRYARGPTICRVELSGEILHDTDKMVGTRRRLLWTLGMERSEKLLHEFMCDVAEGALLAEREAGREPDDRSWRAIETKRMWLAGEATDEELRAAWYAAESAARYAAESADNRHLERMIVSAHRELAAQEREVKG